LYNNFVTFLGVKKTTITLFSISTIFAVLIIATVILLIGNYTKNLNSGINLEPQIMDFYTYIDNDTAKDKVWVITTPKDIKELALQKKNGSIFNDYAILNDYIVLGILGIDQPKPSYNYQIKLNSIWLRSSQVNINYQIISPKKDKDYEILLEEVVCCPQVFFKIARDKLPVGIPLEFIFNNRTEKTEQIINQIITL